MFYTAFILNFPSFLPIDSVNRLFFWRYNGKFIMKSVYMPFSFFCFSTKNRLGTASVGGNIKNDGE